MGPISKARDATDAMAMTLAALNLANPADRRLEIYTAQPIANPWPAEDQWRDDVIAELTKERDKWKRLALFLLNNALDENNPVKT